jgi:hypothetical protein
MGCPTGRAARRPCTGFGWHCCLPLEARMMTPQVQLGSVLQIICEQITSVNQLATAFSRFVEPRKTLPGFSDVVSALFTNDQLVEGAVILCTELGLFSQFPDLGTAAFPPSMKPKRLVYILSAIPYIAWKQAFTRELTDSPLFHLLSIVRSPLPQRAIPVIKPFVTASVEFLGAISPTLLKIVVDIKDVDVLREFTGAFATIRIPLIDRPFEDNFCRMFLHQVIIPETEQEFESTSFGHIISIILMWIGLLYSLTPLLPNHERCFQQSSISSAFDELIVRTELATRPELLIDFTTVADAATTLGNLVKVILELSPAKIIAVIESVIDTLRSNNMGCIISAGVFFVNVVPQLEPTGLDALKTKLNEGIVRTFEVGDASTHLAITIASHSILPQPVLRELLGIIYGACVTGLTLKCDVGDRTVATRFLCEIVEQVPGESVSIEILTAVMRLEVRPRFPEGG